MHDDIKVGSSDAFFVFVVERWWESVEMGRKLLMTTVLIFCYRFISRYIYTLHLHCRNCSGALRPLARVRSSDDSALVQWDSSPTGMRCDNLLHFPAAQHRIQPLLHGWLELSC